MSIPLKAVVSSFHDNDILPACLAHLEAQGVEEIYLVDNGTPGGPHLSAGAQLAVTYTSTGFAARLRMSIVNAVVRHNTTQPTWWLCLDADEFPQPRVGTIRSFLDGLPEDVLVVGARRVDLLPQGPDEYIVGKHPLDCFKLACEVKRDWDHCARGHWKHPLALLSPGQEVFSVGAHYIATVKRMRESKEILTLWHAIFRRREDMEKRAKVLSSRMGDARNTGGMRWRAEHLQEVYAGDWARTPWKPRSLEEVRRGG